MSNYLPRHFLKTEELTSVTQKHLIGPNGHPEVPAILFPVVAVQCSVEKDSQTEET